MANGHSALHGSWGWLVALGVVSLLGGIFALINPFCGDARRGPYRPVGPSSFLAFSRSSRPSGYADGRDSSGRSSSAFSPLRWALCS